MEEGKDIFFFNDFQHVVFMVIWYLANHSRSFRQERGNKLQHFVNYLFWLVARDHSHRQDSTYHSLCYIIYEALPGMRNSSMGPPGRFDVITGHSAHGGLIELFLYAASVPRLVCTVVSVGWCIENIRSW